MKSFEEYIEGIFNPLMPAAVNHRAIFEALPAYVDEVLVPEILSKFKRKPEHLGRRDPQERMEPEEDVNDYVPVLPERSDRVVKLDDVMLVLDGIDAQETDGGWWETSTGADKGYDLLQMIRAASFMPHDGAPTLKKQLSVAFDALEALSVLGSGEVEELLVGNEMALTALGKIAAITPGPVFQGPEKERSGIDPTKATQVIQNNATVGRRCPR